MELNDGQDFPWNLQERAGTVKAIVYLDSLTTELACTEFLLEATDKKNLVDRVRTVLSRAELTHIRFGSVDGGPQHINTFPAPVRNQYANHFWKDDLINEHVSNGSGRPVYHSDIMEKIRNFPIFNQQHARYSALSDMMQSYQFLDWFMIPLKAYEFDKSVFCVTSKGLSPAELRTVVERHKAPLLLLAESVHNVVFQKYPELDQPHRRATINPRPLLLLERLANSNETLNQVADKLTISISTANQQIADAKRSLGARTTVSAVVRAIKLGLFPIK